MSPIYLRRSLASFIFGLPHKSKMRKNVQQSKTKAWGSEGVGHGRWRMPVRPTGICFFLLLTVVAAPLGKPQAHYHHQQSAKWPQLQCGMPTATTTTTITRATRQSRRRRATAATSIRT